MTDLSIGFGVCYLLLAEESVIVMRSKEGAVLTETLEMLWATAN